MRYVLCKPNFLHWLQVSLSQLFPNRPIRPLQRAGHPILLSATAIKALMMDGKTPFTSPEQPERCLYRMDGEIQVY